MGGIAPNEEGTNNVSSNALQDLANTQMQLDPTQRRFLPFNNNLSANMYGPVTTGKTYEASPYFVQPLVTSGTTTTGTSTTGTDNGGGSGGGGGGNVYSPKTITGTPTAPTDGTIYTSTDFAGNKVPYTIVTPTDVRPPGYVDNTPSNFSELRQYYDSSPMNPGGPAIMHSSDGTSTNLGFNLGPSVQGGRGTIVAAQPTYATQPTQDQLDYAETSLDPFGGAGPDVTSGPISGLVSGGGADGVGNFGKVGDFFGGLLGGLNVTGPPVENKVTSYSHPTDNDKPAGPGDTGWEQDRALEALRSGGTGIIYKDDRREVYLDGVMISNPRGAEEAREILARAQAAKEAARDPGPPPMPQYNNNGTPMVTQNYNYGTNMVNSGGTMLGRDPLEAEKQKQGMGANYVQSVPASQSQPGLGSMLANTAKSKGIDMVMEGPLQAASGALLGTLPTATAAGGTGMIGSLATSGALGASAAPMLAAMGPFAIAALPFLLNDGTSSVPEQDFGLDPFENFDWNKGPALNMANMGQVGLQVSQGKPRIQYNTTAGPGQINSYAQSDGFGIDYTMKFNNGSMGVKPTTNMAYADGVDSVPSMLTPGEAVIPAPAAQNPANKPAINAMINEGRAANDMADGMTGMDMPAMAGPLSGKAERERMKLIQDMSLKKKAFEAEEQRKQIAFNQKMSQDKIKSMLAMRQSQE